ncbi:gliding motility lipoprotein GldB [Echinicola marina]|uniref:gliding motility lipoprotein GldB n=1 Tax=Echinicola marina TaxID=2859768 RepID=UPI001CF71B83|nr:gliding motility lipoprotein GldB [Echinicola marina]UCS94388.1 gliding motility lipoprotein GldB [Echinicola marina]
MKKNPLLFLALLIVLFSCKKESQNCEISEEVQAVQVDLKIERLEDLLFEAKGQGDISYFLESHPDFSAKYLQEDLYPSKEALISTLIEIPNDTLMQELYEEVTAEFPSIRQVEQDLETAFKHIKYFYPSFKVPKVYTFVSGFTSDIYLDEDMLVIGLDYFLPNDHRFQPPEMPEYIAKRYDKDHLVPMIITAISSVFNETDLQDNTLLAEMIYYGKAYHFTKSMLPCTPEKFIIGYTPAELAACYSNEDFIWTHLIEEEAIYETNPFNIRKYTGEAPATDVISPDAPGRVGRWVGWNIVDAYSEKNNIGLKDLMTEKDAKKIFMQSAYKPRQ